MVSVALAQNVASAGTRLSENDLPQKEVLISAYMFPHCVFIYTFTICAGSTVSQISPITLRVAFGQVHDIQLSVQPSNWPIYLVFY